MARVYLWCLCGGWADTTATHACKYVCRCPTLPVDSLRSAGTLFRRKQVCRASGDYVTPFSGPEFDVDPSIQTFARRLLAQEDTIGWGGAAIDDFVPPQPVAVAVDTAAAAGGARGGDDYAAAHQAVRGGDWDAGDDAADGGADSAAGTADEEVEEEVGQYESNDVMEEGGWGTGSEGGMGGMRQLHLQRFLPKRAGGAAQLDALRKAKQDAQRKAQKSAAEVHAMQSAALHQQTVRREAAQRIPEFGPARDKLYLERATEIRGAMEENLRRTGWLGEFVPMQMHCPLMGRRVSWQAVSEFAALAWRCDGLGFAWECLYQPLEDAAGDGG